MFGYKNTAGRTLILASVIALTGGIAMAEQEGQGPGDGDRPGHHQGDKDGKWHHGEKGEHGPRADRPGEHGPKAMHKRLFGGMELTEEQKTQVKETMRAFGDERKAWHEAHRDEIQALKEKMRAARQGDDKEAVKAVHEEIKALMESAPKPDAAHDEIRGILNEEQQATFDERITKIRERMEQWKNKKHDGGVGPPHGWHGEGPDGDGPPKGDRHPRGRKLFGNLDLTDEQRATLRETMQSDQTRDEKMAAVREMLNDEQKAQLNENLEKMRKHREERKGKHGEHGKHGHGGPDGDGPKHEGKPDAGSQLDL